MVPSDDLYEIVSEPLGLWAFLRDLPAEAAVAMNAPTWRPPHAPGDDSWAEHLFDDAAQPAP